MYKGTRPSNITVFATHWKPNIRLMYFKPQSSESTQIVCEADGNPEPVYKWYRNGVHYDPSSTNNRVVQLPGKGTLEFTTLEDNDEGYYQCRAENGYGVSVSPVVRFRAAKIEDFTAKPTQVFIAEYGDVLTLHCHAPASNPEPMIFWVTFEVDGRLTPVRTNDRVVMDKEGRLHFLSVKPSDEQGGRSYLCVAANIPLRENKFGPEMKVKVVGSAPIKRPAYEYYSSPTPLTVLKGDELELQFVCAGNPVPTIHWQKLNGSKVIPDRARLTNEKLVIPEVDIQDGGMYKAVCNNEDSSFSEQIFQVSIEAAPTWITAPSDVTAQAGSTVKITCEADGIPAPLVEWFVNGVDINTSKDPRIQSSRFQQVDESHVLLKNVQLTDHMNIQCNATNRWGYAWGDVYINVV